MKALLIVLTAFFLPAMIYGIISMFFFIKEIKADDFNYKKQKALHIIKNKEKYTKLQIQKAQQYLDEEAIASTNQS